MSYMLLVIGLVLVTILYRNVLRKQFALDKESLILRRTRRQVRSCRALATFAQISAACTCLRDAAFNFGIAEIRTAAQSPFHGLGDSSDDRRIRLYDSLDMEIADLETRFKTVTGTLGFRDQCLTALKQTASARSIDVSVSDVVVFEVFAAAQIDDPAIRLYLPFLMVAEELPFTVLSAPDWFYQLVLRVVDEQPDGASRKVKTVSSITTAVGFPTPRVFRRSFNVSTEVLAAAIALWDASPPVADDTYGRFSDALATARLL